MTHAYDSFFAHARSRPDALAIAFGARRWTFGDLLEASAIEADNLRAAGTKAGDVVAWWAGSSPWLVVSLLATWRCGATWLPVNTRYRHAELAHILADARPRVLVTDAATDVERAALLEALRVEGLLPEALRTAPAPDLGPPNAAAPAAAPPNAAAPAAAPPYEVAPAAAPPDAAVASEAEPNAAALVAGTAPAAAPPEDACALLLYTSGTTGPAKGVEHTFASLAAGIGALTAAWEFSPADRISLMLPLFHVHGLGIGVLGMLLRGSALLLHPRFCPRALVDDIRERDATVFMGVPTMHHRLAAHLRAHPADRAALRRLRLLTSGSAPLPAALHAELHILTGHAVLERYGMSETLLTLSNPLHGPRIAGTVGFPVGATRLRIEPDPDWPASPGVTRGELLIRGPSLMRAYRNRPDATRAAFTPDGWFRTGDIAERAPDGRITLLGRSSTDILKSGGWKIAAGEIEAHIAACPGVAEVAVYGIPDPEWGERVCAAIAPHPDLTPGQRAALPEGVVSRLASELADYKRPRTLILVDALPRNALGKVQKRALADLTPPESRAAGESG